MAITAEAILSIIAAEAGLDTEVLKPDATLEGLDLSSLDLVSVVFALEDRFGISIAPEDIAPSFTIAEFINHVTVLSAK